MKYHQIFLVGKIWHSDVLPVGSSVFVIAIIFSLPYFFPGLAQWVDVRMRLTEPLAGRTFYFVSMGFPVIALGFLFMWASARLPLRLSSLLFLALAGTFVFMIAYLCARGV